MGKNRPFDKGIEDLKIKRSSAPLGALSDGGELGELVRSHDWGKTHLGPIEFWPESLRTSLSLILNSQHPMWIGWGTERTFLYNDAYIQILGSSKHPWALGRPFREVWSEIWEVVSPLAAKVFEKGEATFVDDVRLFMKKPREKGSGFYLKEEYYSFSYSPIRDESGEVCGLFCPSADVTSKVLSERRLRTLAELSANTLVEKTMERACASTASTLKKNPDDLPFVLLYIIDPETKQARLTDVAGVARGTEISPEWIDLNSGQSIPDLVWPMSKVIKNGKPSVVQLAESDLIPHGLADQKVREAIVLPLVFQEERQVSGFLVSGVNPARPLDTDYLRFYSLISSHVATALQNAQAAEDEKKRLESLAQIDRAKITFFSNVSHEFRTPLTLMLGPIEDSLRDTEDPLGPQQRERQELTYRNSLRLLKLVNSLLDFSRIEADRMRAVYRPTDLAKFTAGLASIFRSAVDKAGLKLIVDVSNLKEPVYVDRDMWEKIVLNLLSNAFKFTFAGEIEVKLWALDEKVHLSIRDTGTGIPKHELSHIFERFHRVEGASGRTQEGSGIGLALIQELVKLHSGSISVQSWLGEGTIFEVEIPLGKAHIPAESISSSDSFQEEDLTGHFAHAFVDEANRWSNESTSTQKLPIDNARHRILLADDNSDMREYIKSLLSGAWNVETFTNGADALHAALKNPPDLILSDVMMPRLDGFGLIQSLKSDQRTKNIPIILLSARAGEESRIEGLQAGADDYLVKPFSAKDLIARVQTHIQMGKIKGEVEAQRALLNSVFMQAPVGICLLEGPDHIFTIANPTYCSLLFGGRNDFIGKSVRDAVPESAEQGFIEILDRVFRTGEPFLGKETPIDLKQKDGTTRHFYLNFIYQPLRDHDQKIRGIVAIIHDVTEQVQGRATIVFERHQLETIFQQSPAAMALWTGNNFVFEKVNPQYQAIFPDRILLGKPFLEACPEFKDQPFQDLLTKVFETGEPYIGHEILTRHSDYVGGPLVDHYYDFTFMRICDAKGEPYGVYDHAIDVTARVKARHALEDNAERLRQLSESLRSAVNARDTFLGIASHELKTPLTSLKLQIEMNKRTYLRQGLEGLTAPKIEKLLDSTYLQTNRLELLIDDMLDVSRINSGKLSMNLEDTDISATVHEVLERFAPQYEVVGSTIIEELPSGLIARFDSARIEQVLINFITNTIKYAPGGKVFVKTEQLGRKVRVTVRDSGNGIASEDCSRIFERFERATSASDVSGLGLGLYICKQIIEAHSGYIFVESKLGKGSTFGFELPVNADEDNS